MRRSTIFVAQIREIASWRPKSSWKAAILVIFVHLQIMFAGIQCIRLVTRLGFDEKLRFADVAITPQRKRYINVQDIPQSRAGVAEAHPEAHVAQRAGVAIADHTTSPSPADIGEYGSPETR